MAACGGDDDPQMAFCDAASDTDSFEAIFADFDPADTDAALEAFRTARDTEIDLRRDAPEAVRADIDLLVQFLDDLVEGLEDLDTSSTGRPAIYDEISTEFDQIEAASGRIETYVKANCDLTSQTTG
ncbi:hypothetical protein [Actinospongicola halichondriae]|uniref:hypothetical protein n=1 Tax=Actinospongicola halichondriae TaxID=3236844 RepID=UPI003D56AB83